MEDEPSPRLPEVAGGLRAEAAARTPIEMAQAGAGTHALAANVHSIAHDAEAWVALKEQLATTASALQRERVKARTLRVERDELVTLNASLRGQLDVLATTGAEAAALREEVALLTKTVAGYEEVIAKLQGEAEQLKRREKVKETALEKAEQRLRIAEARTEAPDGPIVAATAAAAIADPKAVAGSVVPRDQTETRHESAVASGFAAQPQISTAKHRGVAVVDGSGFEWQGAAHLTATAAVLGPPRRPPSASTAAAWPFLSELLPSLAQLAERLAAAGDSSQLSLAFEEFEAILATVAERIPADARPVISTAIRTIFDRLHALAKTRGGAEKAAKSAADLNAKLGAQLERVRSSVGAAKQRLAEAREREDALHDALTAKSTEVRDLERRATDLAQQVAACEKRVSYLTKAPSAEDLAALGLRAHLLLRVGVPQVCQVWGCVLTTRATAAATGAEPEASAAGPGISWWRVDELPACILATGKGNADDGRATLQDAFAAELSAANTARVASQRRVAALEARLRDSVQAHAAYRQRADALLASIELRASPQAALASARTVALSLGRPAADAAERPAEADGERDGAGPLATPTDAAQAQHDQCAAEVQQLRAEFARALERVRADLARSQAEVKNEKEKTEQAGLRLAAAKARAQRLASELAAVGDRRLPVSLPSRATTHATSPAAPAARVLWDLTRQKTVQLSLKFLAENEGEVCDVPEADARRWEDAAAAAYRTTAAELVLAPDTLRRRIRAMEAVLRDEQVQARLLLEQNSLLKRELRRVENLAMTEALLVHNDTSTLFSVSPGPVRRAPSSEAPATGSALPPSPTKAAPVEYVRNTVIKFMETDCSVGAKDHEALFDVLATLFHLSRDERKRIQQKRAARVSPRWFAFKNG